MKFDVVIIGGGEGGLFSGAILANKGVKVLILEQATAIIENSYFYTTVPKNFFHKDLTFCKT